jgi:hypothetical protein
VASGEKNGDRLGGIRPKRARNLSEGESGSIEPLHNRYWGWVLVRMR